MTEQRQKTTNEPVMTDEGSGALPPKDHKPTSPSDSTLFSGLVESGGITAASTGPYVLQPPPAPSPYWNNSHSPRPIPGPPAGWRYASPSGYYTQQAPEKRPPAGFYDVAQPAPPPPPPQPPRRGHAYYTERNPEYTQVIIVQELSFESKEVRLRFIRKVYSILSIQLLFTTGLIALFLFEPHVNEFIKENALWFLIPALAVYLLTYLLLICVEHLRRKTPGNIIMLIIFTISLSLVAAVSTTAYKLEAVLMAFGITAVVCISVTIFAMQTKFDFTLCGAFIMILAIILLGLGIVLIFWSNKILLYIYAALATLVFTLFLANDTQTIMGGRSIQLSPNEYILGAIQLYLDIIMIFLNVMQLCGLASDS